MPHGAVTAFPQTSENRGKGQDLSGLQAGICLVQHNLTTCYWSSQSEVSATDEPLAGSGAGTALSPTEQVAFHRLRGTKVLNPMLFHSSLFAIAAVPFTLQLRQLPCHQCCKSYGPFCINRGSLILQQPQH